MKEPSGYSFTKFEYLISISSAHLSAIGGIIELFSPYLSTQEFAAIWHLGLWPQRAKTPSSIPPLAEKAGWHEVRHAHNTSFSKSQNKVCSRAHRPRKTSCRTRLARSAITSRGALRESTSSAAERACSLRFGMRAASPSECWPVFERTPRAWVSCARRSGKWKRTCAITCNACPRTTRRAR